MLKLLNDTRIEGLIGTARGADRARAHDCLHPEPSDPVQRMVVALEPDTRVTPHRHRGDQPWELLALLQGELTLLLFDDDGQVEERVELSESGTRVVEFDGARWHALVAQRTGTLMLEVKRGPYRPLGDADFAPWAPRERQPEAAALRERLRAARVGERVSV